MGDYQLMGAYKPVATPGANKKPSTTVTSSIKNRFGAADVKEGKGEDGAFAAAMAAVNALKAKQSGGKVADKVKFAGQSYQIEREKTEGDVKQEMRLAKNRLGGGCEGLDAIIGVIGEKDKNVSSLDKSKIDWDKYTKEKKLEAELETNRKDGYLAKKRFIDSVSELEY